MVQLLTSISSLVIYVSKGSHPFILVSNQQSDVTSLSSSRREQANECVLTEHKTTFVSMLVCQAVHPDKQFLLQLVLLLHCGFDCSTATAQQYSNNSFSVFNSGLSACSGTRPNGHTISLKCSSACYAVFTGGSGMVMAHIFFIVAAV
ncbi:hypothetical protein PROFUN_01849 [Planoprotostelium fungivorum]|uniref:Uncharacterized protein n=1 Tax=Planoprotostelium fungivorum TaxID=1890364 RepID=A0A2P6NYW6_9EUKA|nr:hypothetical protein PROFUN_01849 [Planoprotostelium fungivorum]